MRRGSRGLLRAALSLGFLALPAGARAELGADATRLAQAWSEHGVLRRLPPRLGERTAPTVVFLPVELLSGAPRSCVSVAVLGPSSTHFTVRAAGGAYLPDSIEDWPQASLAGLVQITRCGKRKSRLSALIVEMRSPRAVLEVIAVESAEPVQPATDVLPQRDPGPIAPLAGFGPPPVPAPINERFALTESRAKRDGALEITRELAQSSPRGSGSVKRLFEVGCYRVALLAEPGADGELSSDLSVLPDLDASAALAGIERGDGFGAAMEFCQGERGTSGLRFAGAAANARVWALASRFALPDGLPEAWGGGGRARMAAVLRRHGVRVNGTPVDHALGVQGPTLMPIGLEPGACYVAAITAVQGQAFALALGVQVGRLGSQNRMAPGTNGTLISFCAGGASTAKLEADGRGPNLTWLFALWQTGRLGRGEELLP